MHSFHEHTRGIERRSKRRSPVPQPDHRGTAPYLYLLSQNCALEQGTVTIRRAMESAGMSLNSSYSLAINP
jgi:hypothetical protein